MGSEPLEPAVERDWEGRLIPFEAIEVSVAFWASCFPLPSFSFAFWRTVARQLQALGLCTWATRLEICGSFSLVLCGFGPV